MLGKKDKQPDLLESWGIHKVPHNHFLMRLDKFIKWYRIEKRLKRLYESETGRPSYPPIVLFKGLMLQQFYNLSDPELEEMIFEEPVPDETTFCRFRQRLNEAGILGLLFDEINRQLESKGILLNEAGILGLLFDEINRQLESKGILLKKGSIVDASIIESKNKGSDPEGRWVRYKHSKKAKFGYKLHVSCDPKRQLIQDIELTPANTADTNVMENVVPYEATHVYGDKAYDSYKRRYQLRDDGRYNGILLRYPRTPRERARNKRLSKIRCRVERCFAHLKNIFGYTHVRYRGLIRNKGHAYLLVMAYNMKRALAYQAL